MAIDLKKTARASGTRKYWAVAGVIAVAFLLSYGYATASKNSSSTPAFAAVGTQGARSAAAPGSVAGGAGGAGGAGCACCSGGGSQTTVTGATTSEGGVQKVTVDLTTGSYSPNEITAKAGVPIELDFKGPASSCNGYVQSQDLGFSQDVSNGGTIKLPALKAGTYTWACSMNMYTAKIVVK